MTNRTTLAALAALALLASVAALPPSAAEDASDGTSQDLEASQQDGNTSESPDQNGTDGDTSGTSDQNGTDGDDESGSNDTDQRSGDGADGGSSDGAGEDRGEDNRPERTGPERREVRVDVDRDDGRAELRSEARDGDARSELRLEIRGEDAAMALDFENRTGDARTELSAELRHGLLVEFRDEDGDGAKDPGEPALQTVDLRDRNPDVAVEETDVGPRVTTTYALPGNGTFATTVLLPSGPARVGAQQVTPEEAKIDFRVEGFPFEANDTRLDLQVEVDAAYEARGPAAEAQGVTLQADGEAAYFRWLPNATVDGAVRDVATRVDAVHAEAEDGEAESEYVVHLAYAQGQTIVHDPTFGVQSVEEAVQAVQETLGHLPTYVIAAGATAFLAGGFAYARTRAGPR